MEKLTINKLIIPNKSVITWKRNLVTIILNIRSNQITNKIYNIRFPNMKVLTIIRI